MSEGTWTVERDEDLTAPYAFRKKTWVAFDDRISVSIKVTLSVLVPSSLIIIICDSEFLHDVSTTH